MACDTATLATTALQSLRTEFNGVSNTEELFATGRELLPLNSKCYKIVNVDGIVFWPPLIVVSVMMLKYRLFIH